MAIDLKTFATRLRKASDKIPSNVEDVKKQVVLSVQQSLIETTPVLSGRARTNWRVYNSESEGGDQMLPAPSSVEAGMKEAISQGQNAVTSIKAGKPIYIINRAEYIVRLNNGWSLQAPSNFVQITAQRVADVISKNTGKIVEIQ